MNSTYGVASGRDKLPVPKFKGKQQVNVSHVILLTALVLLDRFSNEISIEVVIYGSLLAQQMLIHKWVHAGPEPFVDRIGEPLLLSIHDFLRQPFFNRFFVEIFSSETSDFQIPWKGLDELDQAIIEKRHA